MLEDDDVGFAFPSRGNPVPTDVVGDVDIGLRPQNIGDDLAHHAAHVDDNDPDAPQGVVPVVWR